MSYYQSQYTGAQIDAAVGSLIGVLNSIGTAGSAGFGVGVAPPEALPDGMTPLYGYTDPTHANYGNYKYADGSIMVWVPKFYYRIAHASNPTYGAHGVNSIDVEGVKTYTTRAAAEAAGYALHRAFIDGGVEQAGFFIDKFMCSKNALGSGYVASSIAGGLPISTHSDHNPIADLTACGSNAYFEALNACRARDGVDGAVNADSIFHCASRFQWAALALLSLAHGQAATSTTYCAWYDASGAENYPKGCNNNALGDANDATVSYQSDGYSNCGKTGSGVPFAKTTHNGQACGVADVNGLMYEIQIGLTCIATSKSISAASQANPCQIEVVGHGLVTGQQALVTSIDGMTELNDRIFTVTVVDADNITLDGVDSTGYAAYTSGGSLTYGTFYAAKEATAMRDFTSGNSAATDHWGATGAAAMMDALPLVLADGAISMKMGDGANQVLAEDVSGDSWRRTCLGLPLTDGQSTSGTNLFGTDYFYRYIRNELCPIASYSWYSGSTAGVWGLHLYNSRAYSSYYVGLRAACYPGA
jgi:hypothetical protein